MFGNDVKKLCLKLANAKSEEEVLEIVKNHPVLKDDKNWRHYGNVSNNLGQVTGQADKSVPSLIEKITNSIDALLIRMCLLRGEDPESPTAPRSMEEAVERYFGINDAKYCDLDEKKRRQIARNIQVIAEGDRKEPNIAIYDNGEGQSPQAFPDTLVSLNRSNKQKIFFVQGKYNMGGTAVIPFCGEQRYQLLISRRNVTKDNSNEPYGFTLIRRNRGIGQHVKTSWYEYCVDEDGKIFEFNSSPLNLGLYDKEAFVGGTYIKLFNYDLRNPSIVTFDLWRDLNRYLIKPALPILLVENRKIFKGHQNYKMMHGNRMRCYLDGRKNIETIFPAWIKSDGTKYPVEVFIFKKDVDTKEFIKDMALIFSVNGQVQHSKDNRFISQDLKKAYLKGHMLLNVDCSGMPRELHEDIFMSSRSHMRDCIEYRNLLDAIAKNLKDNEYLTQLDEKWRKEEIFKNPKDEKFLKNIVGRLLRDDSEIEKLLGLKSGLISEQIKKITKQTKQEGEKFKGKRFPSIFKFKDLKPGTIKMLPQNGECKINIGTDVENEYLTRPHDKGELKIKVRAPRIGTKKKKIKRRTGSDEILDVNIVGPNEGNIQLRIKSNEEIDVGTKVSIDLELSSPEGPRQLVADIKIDNPREKSKEKEIEKKKEYSLPDVIDVYRELSESKQGKCWDDYGWNELDICKIQESSAEGCLVDSIAINMDAKELDNFIRSRKLTGKEMEIAQRTFKTAVYLISLVLFYELHQRLQREQERDDYADERINYEPGDMVAFSMKGLAKILLHILTNESLLKELEAIEE